MEIKAYNEAYEKLERLKRAALRFDSDTPTGMTDFELEWLQDAVRRHYEYDPEYQRELVELVQQGLPIRPLQLKRTDGGCREWHMCEFYVDPPRTIDWPRVLELTRDLLRMFTTTAQYAFEREQKVFLKSVKDRQAMQALADSPPL